MGLVVVLVADLVVDQERDLLFLCRDRLLDRLTLLAQQLLVVVPEVVQDREVVLAADREAVPVVVRDQDLAVVLELGRDQGLVVGQVLDLEQDPAAVQEVVLAVVQAVVQVAGQARRSSLIKALASQQGLALISIPEQVAEQDLERVPVAVQEQVPALVLERAPELVADLALDLERVQGQVLERVPALVAERVVEQVLGVAPKYSLIKALVFRQAQA